MRQENNLTIMSGAVKSVLDVLGGEIVIERTLTKDEENEDRTSDASNERRPIPND